MKQDLKIMVIDDEKPIVDTLMIYFDRIGYNVKGYYDSVEAREVLQKEKYDIVFTDLKMPEVSGMEIVKTVKEQENDTVVIIFTGYAVLTSMKIGGGVIIDLGDWNFTQHKYMLGVYTHIIVLVVGYSASFFFKEASSKTTAI